MNERRRSTICGTQRRDEGGAGEGRSGCGGRVVGGQERDRRGWSGSASGSGMRKRCDRFTRPGVDVHGVSERAPMQEGEAATSATLATTEIRAKSAAMSWHDDFRNIGWRQAAGGEGLGRRGGCGVRRNWWTARLQKNKVWRGIMMLGDEYR
jgi:hypothetical protein